MDIQYPIYGLFFIWAGCFVLESDDGCIMKIFRALIVLLGFFVVGSFLAVLFGPFILRIFN